MLFKYEIVFLAYKLSNYSFKLLNKLNGNVNTAPHTDKHNV